MINKVNLYHKCNGYSSLILEKLFLKLGVIRLFIVLLLLQIMADSELLQVVSGNSRFANQFYNIIAKEASGENLFFSPISAHTVLSLAYQGAAGTSAAAFSSALHVENQNVAATGYNNVMNSLNNIENVTLHMANKVYVMQGFPLKEKFVTSATKLFLAETESLNFSDSANSAQTINNWVENKTNSKIKNLMDPGSLNSLTRLVLINAIYFKGNWAYQFKKSDTRKEKFYISESESVDCDMMHITKHFKYRVDDHLQAQILEMKYTNNNISMVIILPFERNGIHEMEKKLSDVDFSKITEGMRSMEVEVSLPKFKIETTMDLESVLTKMGLGVIFNKTMAADFSEISDSDEQLYVSKVVQKAFIEVNEEGAEAAAATRKAIKMRCAKPRKIEKMKFIVDHPFFLTLQSFCKPENVTLFCGKIVKPSC